MDGLLTKYNALAPEVQREVHNFLDFLLSQPQNKRQFNTKEWKNKIKDISVWSEEDVRVFEENRKLFHQWKIEEW